MISVIKQRVNILSFAIISLLISISYWLIISGCNLADERIFNSFFLQYLWEFNAGIVLAGYYKEKQKLFWAQHNLILVFTAIVGISLMAFMAIKGERVGKTFNDIPASIGYVSVSAFLFSVSGNFIKPLKRFLIFVGKLSYELYLTHMIVFILLRDLIGASNTNIIVSLFLILPIAILVSNLAKKLFAVLLAKTQVNRV
ncbi:MAG: acyltransferase family protein [Sedimentisphaerales bacterium]|nr:acyltransferase family protein [Sedimentisphaerales bacterium]